MAAASAHDIAMNIRRARAAAGITQEAAAAAAGLSRAGYRSLEAGESEPRARTVLALADGLKVKPADLLTPAPPLPQARFRSLKRLNDRDSVLLKVAGQLDDYAALENLLGERFEYALKGLSFADSLREARAEVAADIVRKKLGLKEDEPVRDIGGLLEERAGIKVLRLDVQTDAFFGLSIGEGDGGPAVVVNTWGRISVERWIFTAAHELGHLCLHGEDFDPGLSEEIEQSEREANLFAGQFLMPHAAFIREWDQAAGLAFYWRVLKVKRIFHVSYKTVLYRLQEHGLQGVWQRFQVDARRHTGKALTKSEEPHALRRDAFGWGNPEPSKAREPGGLAVVDFAPDRRYRLVREAVDRGAISLGRGAEILGLPLVQMKSLQASWV